MGIRLNRAAAAAAGAALPLLRRLDPELAHDLGLAALKCVQPLWPALPVPATLAISCFGLQFSHPLGLAAGFDKNGDYLDALGALGFSHVELGTVTPRPQPGNPKPRMFRFPGSEALINRMGFNNKGVDHLVSRLARARYGGIRGISIGKNFDTPIENAQEDYVACLRKVYPHADYVAVNVSSPNTERLRELQARDGLQRILGTLLEERLRLQQRFTRRVPLLIKVAPDLNTEQLTALVQEVRSVQLDGVIATNTSTDLSLLQPPPPDAHRGGLSGAPLHPVSVKIISQLRAELGSSFPIIGVGGIVGAEQACASLRAGANLLQIYTGFAYRGAALIEEILNALPA
jgi:dihydroorotate dehydrogenase